MKLSLFGLGLAMVISLGACAAPSEDEGAPPAGDETSSNDIVTKSADAPIEALRSRVQEDFASAPSLRGHRIVLAVSRIDRDADKIAIQAHVAKVGPDGTQSELDPADAYRAEVSAVLVEGPDGNWKILSSSKAVEAYVVGLTATEHEAFAAQLGVRRSRDERSIVGR